MKATKLGDAIRKIVTSTEYDDEKKLREYIQKSPQNTQDYSANRLVYPNKTLLCTKGQKVQPQSWCVESNCQLLRDKGQQFPHKYSDDGNY